MDKFVERIKVGAAEVTDSGSIVLPSSSTEFELVVERLVVKVNFIDTPLEDSLAFEVRVNDQNEVIYDVRAPQSASDFTIHSPNFATADDGRQISLSFYVNPVKGARGVSRFVAYTVSAI